jgi:hypothetical protein
MTTNSIVSATLQNCLIMAACYSPQGTFSRVVNVLTNAYEFEREASAIS